jgi:hypothetical protein
VAKMIKVDYLLLKSARHNLARYKNESGCPDKDLPYCESNFYPIKDLLDFLKEPQSKIKDDGCWKNGYWKISEDLLPKIQMLAGPHHYAILKALEAVNVKND